MSPSSVQICRWSRDQWNDAAASFQDFSLMQMWEYADAKAEGGVWRVERLLLQRNGEASGLCQCMLRVLPVLGRQLVWINRGPLWRREPGESPGRLAGMLRGLRDYWVDSMGAYLLVAPPIHDGVLSPEVLRDAGYSLAQKAREWASARIDLGYPLDRLRRDLTQSWRRFLSQAERSGVQCVAGSEEDLLSYLLEEYARVRKDKHLSGTAEPAMLAGLQARLRDCEKLWGFVAVKDGKRMGGMIVARYGDTAEYLVGAVNGEGRAVNAGNLLFWQAMVKMKELGCRWFDLGGMHPTRTTPGILHFKAGLRGQPYRYMGNIEASRGGLRDMIIRLGLRWR